MGNLPVQPIREASAFQDLTGTTVGRFKVQAHLGTGGMGEVYRAKDPKLRRSVALKRVAPRFRDDPHYRRMLLKEAERASALSDPHVASIYDVLEERGELFVVMEYVEGETLRKTLDQPADFNTFLDLSVQIAQGLKAAHKRGIVHGDIKPENIIVRPDGVAKILDFGVAKRLPTSAVDGTTTTADSSWKNSFAGTPYYMAPEVFIGKTVDTRADLFSLGVIFYEMLSGQHPFRAETFATTMDNILHLDPPPLRKLNPQIPLRFEEIVRRLLAKEPASRYGTAEELISDLGSASGSFTFWWRTSAARLARTARTLSLPVILAISLVVSAAVVLLWNFLSPAISFPTRIPIAVLPISNQAGDPDLEKNRLTLTFFIISDLVDSPNVRVLPYEQLAEITRGLEERGDDISGEEAIRSIAEHTNAQYVIVPTVFAIGGILRFQIDLINISSGEIENSFNEERVPQLSAFETVYGMLPSLVEGIQDHFRKVGEGQEYQPRPPGSRPQTAAAAILFAQGRNALAQGRYEQALSSFEKAIEAEPSYPLTYAWASQIYGTLGYDQKALALAENASDRITPDTPLLDAYFIKANLAERKYEFSEAESRIREMIGLYADDPVSHTRLSSVQRAQGKNNEAIASLQQALVYDPKYFVAHQDLATLYRDVSEYRKAKESAREALAHYRNIGSREGEANSLLILGDVQRVVGNNQSAKTQFETALRIYEELGNEFGRVRARKYLGDFHLTAVDLGPALAHYQNAISWSGRTQNKRIVAVSLMNIGSIYIYRGEYSQAIDFYTRAMEAAESFPQRPRRRAEVLSHLGGVLMERGPDRAEGLAYAREAITLFEKMGDRGWEAFTRSLVGIYYTDIGKFDLAMTDLQRSLTLAKAIGDKTQASISALQIGRCYFIQNNYAASERMLEEALAVAQRIESKADVVNIERLMGKLNIRLGLPDEARVTLQRALKTAQEGDFGDLLPDVHLALGELSYITGNQNEAREHFRQAIALSPEELISSSRVVARSYLGLLEAKAGNLSKAVSLGGEAVREADRVENPSLAARARINLARVHLQVGMFTESLHVLEGDIPLDIWALMPELQALAEHIRSQALSELGKDAEAAASLRRAQEAVLKLRGMVPQEYQKSFSNRREIREILN